MSRIPKWAFNSMGYWGRMATARSMYGRSLGAGRAGANGSILVRWQARLNDLRSRHSRRQLRKYARRWVLSPFWIWAVGPEHFLLSLLRVGNDGVAGELTRIVRCAV